MSKGYKDDSRAARDAAYRGPTNPFEAGTRRARLFDVWRAHHDRMEANMAHVAAAYGCSWPLPGMVRRFST